MLDARQIWEETTKTLEKVYDQREAENVSYQLLEDQFHISREDVMLRKAKIIDAELLEASLHKLLSFCPVQYVTGVAYFYHRKFKVAPGALIPRPETEELVDLIIKENQKENARILDIGVGSGCITISLALEMVGEVFGTDVSEEALKVARQNAQDLNATVKFSRHDILTSSLPEQDLDILVSNPPYIPESDKEAMHPNVLDFEPDTALFVPNNDPLLFYRRIAEAGVKSLKDKGRLYFEIHERFGTEVQELVTSLGYTEAKIHQDMQGKDRMVSATSSTSR